MDVAAHVGEKSVRRLRMADVIGAIVVIYMLAACLVTVGRLPLP